MENNALEYDIENQLENQESSNSEDVVIKHEEPWTDKSELLLRKWRGQLEKNADLQKMSGYYIKQKHYYITIPTILIPFVMTFLSQAIPRNTPEAETAVNIINGVMFMITSALSGLNAFFGYGQLYEQHFSYASRYSELMNRVETVLASDRKYRIPPDIFITEVKYSLDNFNEKSPKFPLAIINRINKAND